MFVVSLLRVFAAILATAALAGCAAPPHGERVEAPAPQAVVNVPYRLAGGDRLRIIVFGQSDLTNTYNVDGPGAVSMPLIGRVPAQGLTTAELERAVAARLRQGYIRDPSVSIEVEDFRPFFILGAVCSAGQYPFVNGMTVQQAVAVAGGFAPRAVETSVDITRIVDGHATTFAAPLADPVRPGDTITVGSRFL
jgi:polysaccharide biosynthesis/export protein